MLEKTKETSSSCYTRVNLSLSQQKGFCIFNLFTFSSKHIAQFEVVGRKTYEFIKNTAYRGGKSSTELKDFRSALLSDAFACNR